MAKKGRPSKYSKEVVNKICNLISTSSKGLHRICKEHSDLPSVKVIMEWLNDERYITFREQYARAREAQADFLSDEIIEIADTCRIGKKKKKNKDGIEIVEGDMVERSKLQVDARKWAASKLAPKKYGNRIEIDQTIKEQPLFPDITHE